MRIADLYVQYSAIGQGAIASSLGVVRNSLVAAESKLANFTAGVTNLGFKLTLFGGMVEGALVGAAKTYGGMSENLLKMGQRTGIAAGALSELGYAATSSSSSLQELMGGLRFMARFVSMAAADSKQANAILAQLGMTFADIKGLSPEATFLKFADAFSKLPDGLNKATLAMRVFGLSGGALIPMLNAGARGIEDLKTQGREWGITLTTQEIIAGEKFNTVLEKQWMALKKITYVVGQQVAPLIQRVAMFYIKSTKAITDWIKAHQDLFVVALKVGGVLLGLGTVFLFLGKAVNVLSVPFFLFIKAIGLLGTALTLLAHNPIIIVVAGLIALGVWLAKTISGSEELRNKLVPIWDGLKLLGSVIWDVVGPALKWMGEMFSSILNGAEKGLGPIIDAIAVGLVSAIVTAIVAIKNWRQVWDLTWATAKLSLIWVWEEIKFTFTERVPAVLGWFARNWQGIFQTIASFVVTVLGNIVENYRRAFIAIVKYLLGIDWKSVCERLLIAELEILANVITWAENAFTKLAKWLGSINWKDIIMGGNPVVVGAAIGQAIGEKIKEFVSKSAEDIVSPDWKFEWKPLAEGMTNYIKEALVIPNRALTETEKQLMEDISKMSGDLKDEWVKTWNQIMAGKPSPMPVPEEKLRGAGEAPKGPVTLEIAKAESGKFMGFEEVWKNIQSGSMGLARDQLEATQGVEENTGEAVTELAKINKVLPTLGFALA